MKIAVNHICYIIVLIGLCVTMGCKKTTRLFQSLPSSQTGITYSNTLKEDEKFNVLEYMNLYTGAGVAAGDINNDGLTDLYFSGNQVPGRMYLNKGNFTFEDVTGKAGLLTNRWCTGVSMVDINADGWLDIYVNVAGSAKFGDMHNLLYINNRNGTFTEKARQYGLAETRQTMNASFFDYDRDGDLDLFLITNPADEMVTGVNTIHDRMVDGESAGSDILYRNNGNETFSDVSRAAGILVEGYSLGAAISDLNGDGWPDIYVSNDFLTNDILYINNRNGSFSERSPECLKHTSFASMGNDVADFNNDGLPDIYTLDMLPEGNYRKKMIIPPASYDKFQLSLQKGYEPQYSRNALQLNNGNGTFSDISFLSGVSSTDWSWSALWADYDNDGDKDLLVTNGFYRDLGNLDYINYQARLQNPMGRQDAKRQEKLKAISKLDNVPLQNYVFENNSDLTFSNRSDDWGLTEKGFSNGACYADLDNDGDLDLVINCFNAEARVYRNNAERLNKNAYLGIRLKGRAPNIDGIGSKVWVYVNGQMQFQEFYPARGYESSVQPVLHFGLGNAEHADSLKILWPDGTLQSMIDPPINRTLIVAVPSAPQKKMDSAAMRAIPETEKLFSNITGTSGLIYGHREVEFSDFKIQPLLPHMFSKDGPGIAAGDVNGDGLEDFFIGGTAASPGCFFFQTRDKKFIPHPFTQPQVSDNMGVLLFDADNDNDQDLYIVGGGSEHPANDQAYQDGFFKNDGRGNFSYAQNVLPSTVASGSCVVACDYDHDGDLDLFVGGRVSPASYPMPPRSYLLRNDRSATGEIKFTDVTSQVCPQLPNIGMITSALWSDYDNDGWNDLVLCGEFMPFTFLKNNQGKQFTVRSLAHSQGWWNSLAAGDFDNDGDIDYIAGNLGLNSRHKASTKEPLCIYAKDFDKNGLLDPLMCYYVGGKNYLYPSRDEIIRQIASMRVRFSTYEEYARASFDESFTPEEIGDAYVVKAECFETSYFINQGNGRFRRIALPVQAQLGPVFGMTTGDYDEDGHLDVLLAGNDYSTEASTGRYDAMSGLLLAGDGKGNFAAKNSAATGFRADGDVKALADVASTGGDRWIVVANNSAPMEVYRWNRHSFKEISVRTTDLYAIIHKKNGQSYRQEFYFGSNYLSQSSRTLQVGKDVSDITLYNIKGLNRKINITP